MINLFSSNYALWKSHSSGFFSNFTYRSVFFLFVFFVVCLAKHAFSRNKKLRSQWAREKPERNCRKNNYQKSIRHFLRNFTHIHAHFTLFCVKKFNVACPLVVRFAKQISSLYCDHVIYTLYIQFSLWKLHRFNVLLDTPDRD